MVENISEKARQALVLIASGGKGLTEHSIVLIGRQQAELRNRGLIDFARTYTGWRLTPNGHACLRGRV